MFCPIRKGKAPAGGSGGLGKRKSTARPRGKETQPRGGDVERQGLRVDENAGKSDGPLGCRGVAMASI